ncbi:hypothetical protein HDU98_007594 [Podochytrium sp. JEL0797]|nr:hypothetical protein HDU98_007594 [Podochytrium sp. JEL0797]
MFSSRMNFADQADWCDSGVLAAKQRLAASGRLPWVAGQDSCLTGYSQGGFESRGEFGPLGYPRFGGAYGRQNVGGFNIQNLLQQQQQQQLFDDLECSTGGYNHPLLANHPLLNAAVNRFQHGDHPLLDRAFPLVGAAVNRVQSVKANIVDELVQDRHRDEIQAHLIKQLIRKTSSTAIMDYATDSMIKNLLNDSLANRNADHIIFDLASGRPHLPHPEQKAIAERENFIKDQIRLKGVQRFTAPYANKRIVTDQAVANLLDTLAKAQQVGYGSYVTPSGIQYGPACDSQQQQQQAWF